MVIWMWMEFRTELLRWGLLSGMIMNVYCVGRLDVECVCHVEKSNTCVVEHAERPPYWILSPPRCPQPFSPRECLRLGRARRAPRPCTTKAPLTRTRTTASTTPRWTGGSLCATPGTWSRRSGQLCSNAPQMFADKHTRWMRRSQIKSRWSEKKNSKPVVGKMEGIFFVTTY